MFLKEFRERLQRCKCCN